MTGATGNIPTQTDRNQRFSAKLLFQFKVNYVAGGSDKRRTCEERILCFAAENARKALRHAQKVGRASQYSYRNDRGDKVSVDFLGVMDLITLGAEAGDEEVWYDIVTRVSPDERRGRFIPPDQELIKRACKQSTETAIPSKSRR